MTETVLIFNGSAETPDYRWFASGSGEPQAGCAAAVASAFADRGPVTVLLGSAHVLLTDVAVTVRNRRLLANAVAYALEDGLADDVENLLFDVGAETAAGYPVAVIARALVDAVAADLGACGFNEVRFVPYVFAVPHAPEHRGVLHDGTLTVVRTSATQGFTAGGEAARRLLARPHADPGGQTPTAHYAHADADPVTAPDEPLQRIAATTFNEWLAGNLNAGPLLEFRPGATVRNPRKARKLMTAAALLLAALVVHTAFLYAKTATNERRLAAVEQQTHNVFSRAFPQVRRIVNPRVQAERLLAELAAGRTQELGFLDGLHALGASVAGPGEPTRLKSIRYHSGRFDVTLDTDGIASLEQIRTHLAERSLRAEIVSADNRAERVSARLQIEEAPL